MEGLELFFLGLLLSLLNKLTGKLFIACGVEAVACVRGFVKTHDLNGNGGTGLLKPSASFVDHDSDTTDGRAGNNDVSGMKRTVLNKKRCDRTSALIKSCFNNNALSGTFRICLQFKHFRNKQD